MTHGPRHIRQRSGYIFGRVYPVCQFRFQTGYIKSSTAAGVFPVCPVWMRIFMMITRPRGCGHSWSGYTRRVGT